MRARILVEVPDDWLTEYVAQMNATFPEDPPDLPAGFLLARLRDVCSDELPLALYQWPATFTVEEIE